MNTIVTSTPPAPPSPEPLSRWQNPREIFCLEFASSAFSLNAYYPRNLADAYVFVSRHKNPLKHIWQWSAGQWCLIDELPPLGVVK